MTNVILCGGNGTRLWPISRTLMPKQFVKLFDNKSLFQLTIERNSKVCDSQFIVSNTEQYFLALDQLEELNNTKNKYLLEPIGRNTAPAIALACMALDKDELVLVTPSDHLIKDEIEYEKVLEKAKELAIKNNLVTFGITPTFAETGFGYIESIKESFNVKAFHEKPDVQTAQKYVNAGNYYWNSGMFMFKAGVFLDELKKYSPEIYEGCERALLNSPEQVRGTEKTEQTFGQSPEQVRGTEKTEETFGQSPEQVRGTEKTEETFGQSPEQVRGTEKMKQSSISTEPRIYSGLIRIKHDDMIAIAEDSIDYAVMEKSNKVKVIPSDIKWSDVGSFDALFEELPKDKDGNTINKNHISIGSKNNLIYGKDKKIATVDIEDMIIVDTGDALLISKKGSSQKVKEIVKEIRKTTQLHNVHLTGHRPWGTFTILEDSNGYKIKRIEVKPGKRLSLQRHKHRNEHWIVVDGKATVTINDDVFTLNENESTYIKAGDIHRLSNDTNMSLVIIEAQVGSYTGEDDIERLDDDYKRN